MAAPSSASSKKTDRHHHDETSTSACNSSSKFEATQPIVDLAAGGGHHSTTVLERGDEDDGDAEDQEGRGEGAEDEGRQGLEGNEWEEGEVERGMLHALVELGHLEMLLHQARFESWRGFTASFLSHPQLCYVPYLPFSFCCVSGGMISVAKGCCKCGRALILLLYGSGRRRVL